jgi:hypothetical protein
VREAIADLVALADAAVVGELDAFGMAELTLV